jgi:hypothetical protein
MSGTRSMNAFTDSTTTGSGAFATKATRAAAELSRFQVHHFLAVVVLAVHLPERKSCTDEVCTLVFIV